MGGDFVVGSSRRTPSAEMMNMGNLSLEWASDLLCSVQDKPPPLAPGAACELHLDFKAMDRCGVQRSEKMGRGDEGGRGDFQWLTVMSRGGHEGLHLTGSASSCDICWRNYASAACHSARISLASHSGAMTLAWLPNWRIQRLTPAMWSALKVTSRARPCSIRSTSTAGSMGGAS